MKGILLLAVGHPYYGKMAYNLAVSLKAAGNIPVDVLHDDKGISHLENIHKVVFDQFTKIKPEHIERDGQPSYLLSKTYLNEYTRFKETVYMDCDVIFSPFKNPADMFTGENFKIASRGSIPIDGKSDWIELKEVKEKYGFESWPDVASEFIYFKKADKVFKDARKFMTSDMDHVTFAGDRPDEPGFSYSVIQNKIEAPLFNPFYWQPHFNNRFLSLTDIVHNYYGLSMGGKEQDKKIIGYYNDLKKHFQNKTGKKLFDYQNKKDVIKERRLL